MKSFVCASLLTLILITQSAALEQEATQQDRPSVIRKSGEALQSSATKKREPDYPPSAKAVRVSGSVVVEVTVDEEGNVISARAISGHALLKDSAREAAQGWKFKPTLLSGVPVKVIGEITFNFSLEVTSKQIDALLKEVDKNPTSAEGHYKLGSAYYDANMFDEAIKELKEAIRLNPEFAQAHCKLGLSHRAFNPKEAAISFKQAIRIDPRYLEAIVGLGAVNIRLGLYDDAIASFERAIELEPKSAGSLFSLGFAYSKTGRNEEAISTFKKGIKIYPENPQAHYSLGKLYVATGNKQAARDEYAVLKKLDAHLAEALLKEIGK